MFKKLRLWILEQQVKVLVEEDSGKKEPNMAKTTKKTVAKKVDKKADSKKSTVKKTAPKKNTRKK